jgi:superfamily II DNA or RNA helicase
MDKGTDVEALDTIIMDKPNNNKNDTEQQSGRVRRKLEGKPDPEVHDFIDGGQLAYTFANNRNRWYSAVDGKGYIILNPEAFDEAKAILIKKGLTNRF